MLFENSLSQLIKLKKIYIHFFTQWNTCLWYLKQYQHYAKLFRYIAYKFWNIPLKSENEIHTALLQTKTLNLCIKKKEYIFMAFPFFFRDNQTLTSLKSTKKRKLDTKLRGSLKSLLTKQTRVTNFPRNFV